MIVERSLLPDFLTNTYLVGEPGGTAFFVDAGGPVAPLIEVAEREGMTPTHVLLTHHHYDHVLALPELLERWPDIEVLIHPAERELVDAGDRRPDPGRDADDRRHDDRAAAHARVTPPAWSRCSSTGRSSPATRSSRAPSAASARPAARATRT